MQKFILGLVGGLIAIAGFAGSSSASATIDLIWANSGTATTSVLASDTGIVLQVIDTGIGIPEHDLARVMEPFTQVDSSLSRTHEGTGLGLPLSRVLAELHGGRLTLDSVFGNGTVATVHLPVERWLGAENAA